MTEQDHAAPVWPAEPGWRIRAGVGLVANMPMSDERRAVIAREEAKEAQAAKLAEEQRQTAVVEHRGELLMRGITPTSVEERLAAVAQAQDRQDRRDEKADEAYREKFGYGRPRQWVSQLAAVKAEREQREAEQATTAATVAELGKVKASLERLKHGVFTVTGYKVPL
jgi:hypothetical protein